MVKEPVADVLVLEAVADQMLPPVPLAAGTTVTSTLGLNPFVLRAATVAQFVKLPALVPFVEHDVAAAAAFLRSLPSAHPG